jgi:iron complex outermembrane receptor protein
MGYSKSKSIKRVLLAGCALSVLVPGVASFAQSIDEIVVTARRQSESLRDVPATVSVITADTLERTGAQTAEDFLNLTPGVTIVTNTAEAGDTQINIRGMNGARDAEGSVALVVDGILKTNTAQLNQNHGTLRQVEVLKGPQGAIYGRNAAAGAIAVSTLKAGDSFEGKFEISGGEDSTYSAVGHISGPLSDNVGFVLSFADDSTDGFRTNQFLNKDNVDNQDNTSVAGRLTIQVSPQTELDIKARFAETDGGAINFNAAFHLPAFAALPGWYENVNDKKFSYYANIPSENEQETTEFSIKLDHDLGGMNLTAWALYSDVEQSLVADGTSADLGRYTSAFVQQLFGFTPTAAGLAAAMSCVNSVASLQGYQLQAPGFIGATATTAVFDANNQGSIYGPYSPTTCDGTQYQERNQKDFSTEVRIASNNDGPFNWQAGMYYLDIEREVGVSLGADLGQGVIKSLYNAPSTSNPTSLLYHDRFDTEVTAFFASADYQVSDRTTISVAGRYDIEDREVTNLVPVVNDPITLAPINPGIINGVAIAPKSQEYKQFQPKLSFKTDLSDDTTLYGNWGVGFKSGGFNNSGAAATIRNEFTQANANLLGANVGADVAIADDFRKEKSSAFELGLKGNLLGGRVNYDLAGYYTEVDDMQFFEFFVGTFGLLRVVSNIDEVELYGAELALNSQVTDNLKIFGSFNVTESEIKKNAVRPITVGNRSPHTPDYTANLGVQYEQEVGGGMMFNLRADYRVVGPTYFHTVQDETVPTLFSALFTVAPNALFNIPAFLGDTDLSIAERDAYGVLNLRAGLEKDNWALTLYADNLLDEEYLSEVITAAEFGGSFISPGSERRVGLLASYKF